MITKSSVSSLYSAHIDIIQLVIPCLFGESLDLTNVCDNVNGSLAIRRTFSSDIDIKSKGIWKEHFFPYNLVLHNLSPYAFFEELSGSANKNDRYRF